MIVPDGIIGDANIGHTASYDDSDIGESTHKAILNFGLLDLNQDDLEAINRELKLVGITSDMFVVDIGTNRTSTGDKKYKVGDKIYLS